MPTLDDLTGRVASQSGLTPEGVRQLAQEKRALFGGFLTPGGALRLIAREKGVALPKPEAVAAHRALASLRDGEEGDALVRVLSVAPPRSFVRDGREGRVGNVTVADASGTATLVLWNSDVTRFEKLGAARNACLSIRRARVKTAAYAAPGALPVELHAGLLTQLKLVLDDPALPRCAFPLLSLSQVDSKPFDFVARVLSAGDARVFARNGREGRVAKLVVADASATANLVLWDEWADFAQKIKPGDIVRAENVTAKRGAVSATGASLDVYAARESRLLLNPPGEGVAGGDDLWRNAYPAKKLEDLRDGDEALVTATLRELPSAKSLEKCASCNSTLNPNKPSAACACGATRRRSLFIVEAVLEDAGARRRASFFDREARDLLGLPALHLDPQALLDLKKEYLLGKRVRLVVKAKHSSWSNSLELTARHVLALE